MRNGVACFVLPPTHIDTFIAVDLVTRAGFTMMRQDECPIWAIILVMIDPPVRSGMILQIRMEGRNFSHSLLLRGGVASIARSGQ